MPGGDFLPKSSKIFFRLQLHEDYEDRGDVGNGQAWQLNLSSLPMRAAEVTNEASSGLPQIVV